MNVDVGELLGSIRGGTEERDKAKGHLEGHIVAKHVEKRKGKKYERKVL